MAANGDDNSMIDDICGIRTPIDKLTVPKSCRGRWIGGVQCREASDPNQMSCLNTRSRRLSMYDEISVPDLICTQ